MSDITWLEKPVDQSYGAAEEYLSLILGEDQASEGVALIRDAPVIVKKAGDILRASGHTLAPESVKGVARTLAKIKAGDPLSPVLLFRAYPMIIADGYHRVSALCHLDPDTLVHCQLV